MVPAQGAPRAPRFPQYVEWIMQNQHDNGSWGLGHFHLPWLGKDAISSTLACILALKTWDIGDEHIRKGIATMKLIFNSFCVF
jgi:UDP-N-acetylmuramyl pentapeptide synthase